MMPSSSRKVINLGKTSFAVILPKDWITSQQIEKGSEILLFPQKNGQMILRKSRVPQSKLVLNATKYNEELLEAVIHSAYILNIDEVIIQFSEVGDFQDQINRLTEISKTYTGMNLAITGKSQITITGLVNMVGIRIADIFDQILALLMLILDQIERKEYDVDNASQMHQMEAKYQLGVRHLIFALRNQQLDLEIESKDIIQVLGSRIALRSLHSLVVQVNNLRPLLRKAEIPHLSVILKYMKKLTQFAIKGLSESHLRAIEDLLEYRAELQVQVAKINDSTGVIHNFFLNYFEIIRSMMDVMITRHVEQLEETLD